MKLKAPKYYKDFACIADKCKNSCCVGWEIDIDTETIEYYKSLQHSYKDCILSSIDFSDTPHFKLKSDDRCPHLNEKGLCNMILKVGEGSLCHICREHPRFYNELPNGREVGIGMSCEEACRIILNSCHYDELVEIQEIDSIPLCAEIDVIQHRNHIYGILKDTNLSYSQKLKRIYDEYKVSPSLIPDEEWWKIIQSLEFLKPERKATLLQYSSCNVQPVEIEPYLEKALAYFIFRHCTESYDMYEYRVNLGLCLFCERLFASVLKSLPQIDANSTIHIGRIISEEIEYSEDNTETIKTAYEETLS